MLVIYIAAQSRAKRFSREDDGWSGMASDATAAPDLMLKGRYRGPVCWKCREYAGDCAAAKVGKATI